MRVVAIENSALPDGLVTVPKWLTGGRLQNLKLGEAKVTFGSLFCLYGLGGAAVTAGETSFNVGFVLLAGDDDAAAERFRDLGRRAGLALHAYNFIDGLESYESPLVLWLIAVYQSLWGSKWVAKVQTADEFTTRFHPFIASIETLKRIIQLQEKPLEGSRDILSCPDTGDTKPDGNVMLGIGSLMETFGIPESKKGALEKRLERFRKSNPGCDGWQEVTEPRPNQPRYLYRHSAISGIANGLRDNS